MKEKWDRAEERGQFREDLFEAFVFMNALTGGELPAKLRRLLSPGTLASVIRETYARGKAEDDDNALDRVVKWGSIATEMEMSDAVREEILGTVCRAYIRARRVKEAQATIDQLRESGYRSSDFLQGHLFRKNGQFSEAIPYLEGASEGMKFNRSAVHELALAYQGAEQIDALEKLWDKHGSKISDSAMFLDFEIGRDLRASKDDSVILEKIRRLRSMADDEGRADLREAQRLLNIGEFKQAKEFLSSCLLSSIARKFHVRRLRCRAAIRDRDFSLARQDIDTIARMAGRKDFSRSLEADLEAHKGDFEKAKAALRGICEWSSHEWRQYAKILEMEADSEPSITKKSELAAEAARIFGEYGAFTSSDF